LTWIPTFKPTTCYTIFSGNLIEGLQAPSISYDTQELQFTAEVVLHAGAQTADILVATSRMKALEDSLRDWMKDHSSITLKEAKTLILQFTMSPDRNASSSA